MAMRTFWENLLSGKVGGRELEAEKVGEMHSHQKRSRSSHASHRHTWMYGSRELSIGGMHGYRDVWVQGCMGQGNCVNTAFLTHACTRSLGPTGHIRGSFEHHRPD